MKQTMSVIIPIVIGRDTHEHNENLCGTISRQVTIFKQMKYIITTLLCACFFQINAQKIENTKLTQKGGELLIQYDLSGSENDLFKISVFASANNNDWEIIEKVYGDVGDSINTGKNKNIVLWIDHLKSVKDNMHFKVFAEYYTVDLANEGNLTDKNGYTYPWIRFGKNRWMTQNLKANKTDDDCGGVFNNSNARNICPDGWQLPTDEDWMELEIQFGVDKEKANEHGLREIKLDELTNKGFEISECNYNTTLYPNQKALAFWSGSENKMLYMGYSDKYFARIFRIDENKISKELRNKTEELSVRCVQNATYLANIESVLEINLDLNPVGGTINHPYTGEKLEWQYIGGSIWLKKDVTGSYKYKELTDRCPAGWRLPEKDEWEKLINEFQTSIELENQKEITSERISATGIWSFNLSSNDYWMDINYYTYNTFWINKDDKDDSKKLIAFPTNTKGSTGWVKKQTNEKAKVRCLLDNEDFISKRESIKSGNFKDNRDQREYGFVEIDNKIWMSENLNFDMGENSACRDNIKTDCELFGHMYNLEVINNGCPDGWRLPTSDEWKYLLINKAANNLKILYPFGGTGFNLLLGGEVIFDDDEKTEINTAKYLFLNGDKAGYYYIDSKGKVELNEKAKKKDYYYVRCVKK